MKSTSIKAYHEELESGHITKRQQEVINFWHGYPKQEFTAKDISMEVPGAWKRLSELERMGVVQVVGTELDTDSNKWVSTYTLTGCKPLHKPVSVKKPKYIVPVKLAEYYDSAYIQGIKDALFWSGYKRTEIEICVNRVKEAQK